MSNFKELFISLKSAITDQSHQLQIKIIVHLVNSIEQSKNKAELIKQMLSKNLGPILNDIISTELSTLMPTLTLIRHLMEDSNFRNHQFLSIFINILRVLILLIQSEKIETSQLELFKILDILDVFLQKYLLAELLQTHNESFRSIFVCLLNFIELVVSANWIVKSVKNVLVEFYLHLLCLNKLQKCVFQNFELIMRISSLADVFFKNLLVEYRKHGGELWLFKITEIIFRMLESFDYSDTLQVRCLENIVYGQIYFVMGELMQLQSSYCNAELFKLCISILNLILWTPGFTRQFCSKILKKTINLNVHTVIFNLAKSSRKIRKYTQYSMKLFLSSLIAHSTDANQNNNSILQTFLQSRFSDSIIDLKASEVVKNNKVLILLYGCFFLRQTFRDPLSANRILENIAIILNHEETYIQEDEIWSILKILAYYSNYAVLSVLERTGVQRISENLLNKVSAILNTTQKIPCSIDKYIIAMASEFIPNTKTFNTMIRLYLCQEPTLISSRIGEIVLSRQALPFLVSSDYNQVVNAVVILQRKRLKEEDLAFIVEQCFSNLESEEVIIDAALYLIEKNARTLSVESTIKVYIGTIAFLEAKQFNRKFSMQCYYSMMKLCVYFSKACLK